MEHLQKIFQEYRNTGCIKDTGGDMVIQVFDLAIAINDEDSMAAMIFPGSPVLTAEKTALKDSYIQYICKSRYPNLVIIQLLINFGINIDHQDVHGQTALHTAISVNDPSNPLHLNLINLLLKNGANQEIKDKYGLTPIQLSLFSGNLDAAEELLKEKYKSLNISWEFLIDVDRTKRCRHLVKRLLFEENVCNVVGTNYSVLLHFLIFQNDEETFENVMNDAKFNVNAINHKGERLLHAVAKFGTPRMIKALINVGADIEANCQIGVNDRYQVNETPLIVAIKKSRIENVRCLLDCGASLNKNDKNPNKVDFDDKRGIGIAATRTKTTPFTMRHPSTKKQPSTMKSPANRTPLDQACLCGKLDIVKLLLSRGAKINQGDVSSLHHAVLGENTFTVKLILEQGANVNYRCAPQEFSPLIEEFNWFSPIPRTPLECAIELIRQDSVCKDITDLLIFYGFKVNVPSLVTYQTPLHLIFFSTIRTMGMYMMDRKLTNRPATVKLLLECNANVNALDLQGFVPLYYALRNYRHTKRLKPAFVTLVVFIAKLIESGEFVRKENLILLEDEFVRPIYQQCAKELSLLKKNICESRNFSFFDILYKNINSVGGALKIKDISHVLKSYKYKEIFPIHASFLKTRLKEAKIRQSRVDLGIVLFKKHVNDNILDEGILKIFNFLNIKDLTNFAKAGFVDCKRK